MTSCFFRTSVIELKAVEKFSHVHRNEHGYGKSISRTSLWKSKNTGFFRCQSGESDRAFMQQWKETQEIRALKKMGVSATATTTTTIAKTSISNGIGILEFLSRKTYFITGATGFLAKGMAHS